MKSLSFFVIIALVHPVLSQSNIPKPTHEVIWNTIDHSIPLTRDDENYFFYDNNQNIVQIVSNSWNGNSWFLHSKTFNTLDSSGNNIESLTQSWDTLTQVLTNAVLILRSYDAHNNLLSFKRYWWDSQLNSWVYYFSLDYFYNFDNLIIQKIYNYQNSIPIRENYSYDSLDRITIYRREQYINNEWKNGIKYTYYYIDNNLDYSYFLTQDWDDDINDWGGVHNRITQTISPLLNVKIYEYLSDIGWLPSIKDVTIFNENHQMTEYTDYLWDPSLQNWRLHYIIDQTYNPDLSLSQIKHFIVNTNPQILFQLHQTDYYYTIDPVNTNTPILQSKVSLSPNPVTDFARINVENPEKKPVTYALFNAGGRLLRQWTSPLENNTLHMMEYPPGAYYLRVTQGGAASTLSLIKH